MKPNRQKPKNSRILRFFILNPFRLQKHEKPIVKEKAGIADDFWDDVTGNNEFLKIRNKFKKRRQLFVGKGKDALHISSGGKSSSNTKSYSFRNMVPRT